MIQSGILTDPTCKNKTKFGTECRPNVLDTAEPVSALKIIAYSKLTFISVQQFYETWIPEEPETRG